MQTFTITQTLEVLVLGLALGAALGATAAIVILAGHIERRRASDRIRLVRAWAHLEQPVQVPVERPAWLDELTTPELETIVENPHGMRADRLAHAANS